MRPTLKLVSEEIVRWAFEVSINSGSTWKIAFTNPTAGPWKRVMGLSADDRLGEVHRFEIDEKRPDLVIYSDIHKSVIIIEAKTDLRGLADKGQIQKTSALFERLTLLLKSKSDNPFWSERTSYEYTLGLLWGAQDDSLLEIDKIVKAYLTESTGLFSDVLCIQGAFTNESLSHTVFWGSNQKIISLEGYQS